VTFWVNWILKVTQVTKILAMTDSVMNIAHNVFYVYLPAMLLIFQKMYLCLFQCEISDCKHKLTITAKLIVSHFLQRKKKGQFCHA